MKKNILLLWLFITIIFHAYASDIVINELMTKNVSFEMYHLDNVRGFSGWVELHNNGSDSVDVKGYKFSDHKGNIWTNVSSIVIPPDSFYVFWFSEKNKKNHTNFKLDPEGGLLTLKNSNGETVDECRYPEGIRNLSYGHINDGIEKNFFIKPTLGKSNADSNVLLDLPSAPFFSVEGGFYSDPINIEITAEDSCDIYYTTDGSEPTILDSLYQNPLELNKTTVVRAIAVKKKAIILDSLQSETYVVNSLPVSSSYFINERDISIPVVSLSIDEKYLYDDEYGIYVVGNERYPQKYSGWTWLPYANYWGDEKRPLNIEYFDTSKVRQINQEIGISVYGGYSRSYDKKSLELNPSKIYGDNQFRYSIFESKQNLKLKSILLRSSGQDYSHSYLRDAFINTLVENCMDLDIQAYTPCSVFLNGNYWGLMNLRERHNKDYIFSNYGYDDGIKNNVDRSSKYSRLKNNDINSDAANVLIDSLFDINEIMNFTLTQIYCANTDWGGNNITFWSRPDEEYWRVILYDTDEGFSNGGDNKNLNTVSYAYKNSVIKYLLGNDKVKNTLLSKAVVHLSTSFSPIRVERILDSLSSRIESEALYYQNFRAKLKLPYSDWANEIKKMHTFAKERPSNVFAHFKTYYSLGDTSSIHIYAEEEGTEFYFNDEKINTNDFLSKCFQDFAFDLKCCPPAGYLFDHWEITTKDSFYMTKEDCFQTKFPGTTIYHAVLKRDTMSNTNLPLLYLNEICITNKMYLDEYRESNDWIEIYNAGTTPVDLAGMYLSDKKNKLQRSLIPAGDPKKTTVLPKGYIVFWADEEPGQGANHLDFSLSASKRQTVSLSMVDSDSNVVVLDSVTYELHEKGETYARMSYDSIDSWSKTKWPTFATQNRLFGYEISRTKVTDSLETDTSMTSLKELVESKDHRIHVYPNPTSDIIHVECLWNNVSYIVYGNGTILLQGVLIEEKSLNLKCLPKGLYILSLMNSDTGEYEYMKILKQ